MSRLATVNLLLSGNIVAGWVVGSDANRPEIKRGSRLLAVDGKEVTSDSVAAALSGPAGSMVQIVLREETGVEHVISLQRESHGFTSPSRVLARNDNAFPSMVTYNDTPSRGFSSPSRIVKPLTPQNGVNRTGLSEMLSQADSLLSKLRIPGPGSSLKDELNRLGETIKSARETTEGRTGSWSEELEVSKKAAAAAERRAEKLEKEVAELRENLAKMKRDGAVPNAGGGSRDRMANYDSDLKRMIEKLQNSTPSMVNEEETGAELIETRRRLERALNSEEELSKLVQQLEADSIKQASGLRDVVGPLESVAQQTSKELSEAKAEIVRIKSESSRQLQDAKQEIEMLKSMLEDGGATQTKPLASIQPTISVPPSTPSRREVEETDWKKELMNIRNTLAESQKVLGRELTTIPGPTAPTSVPNPSPVSQSVSQSRLGDIQRSIDRARELREGLELSMTAGFPPGRGGPQLISDGTWLM